MLLPGRHAMSSQIDIRKLVLHLSQSVQCANFYFAGGGCFRAKLVFPSEYPLMPPKMKFVTPIFHPNIYASGEVCISILHPPEEDKYGYESAAERWSPVQTPETILLSVISMLSSPNDESPANIEAGKLWREDPKEFKKRVRKCVRDSQENAWD